MNNKLKSIVTLIFLVVFIVVAYWSYKALSERFDFRNGLLSNKSDLDKDNGDKGKNKDNEDNEDNGENNHDEKSPAKDFKVYDINDDEVNLFDFKGKPIVVNFWASWCPPCKREMPYFNEAYLEYKDQVVFMMVDLVDGRRETKDSGSSFIEEMGYEFPVYFDTEEDAAYTYWVTSIPTTLFIDKDGNIVKTHIGAMEKDALVSSIKLITE